MDARDEFDEFDEFDAFVRARWRPLPRAATLLTGDVHAAENLGRETLSGAARRWAVVCAAGSPEAYVRRAGYAAGTVTPSAALVACLDRVARLDPAVVEVLGEESAVAARESDERWDRGEPRPLEGIPFGIKDIIGAEGQAIAFGSAAFRDTSAPATATAVRRLQEAGAVLVARLATYEFAIGPTDDTANPWSTSRRSGGSSSGSAAAVAAGFVPLALGTDTGGSIRVPAAWCGVTGLKPTYGLVPMRGIAPLSSSLDHVGTIAVTAADIARVLPVLAGAQLEEAGFGPSAGHGATSPAPDLSGLVLGIPGPWFWEQCADDVRELVESAIAALVGAGARTLTVDLPSLGPIDPDLIKHILIGSEARSFHEGDPSRWPLYTDGLRGVLEFGSQLSALDYVRAQRLRVPLRRDVQRVFTRVHVIVAPTATMVAPPRGEDPVVAGQPQPLSEVVARNTSVFNVTGHPALTVPCGLTATTMPVGLQIVAATGRDLTALRVGEAFQQLSGHHRRMPPL